MWFQEKHILSYYLSVEKLIGMFFEITSPYTDAIFYPDCVGNWKRTLSQQNYWLILRYVGIYYILVLCVLC